MYGMVFMNQGWSGGGGAAGDVPPSEVHEATLVMSKSPRDHENMKQLVTIPNDVESAWSPALGDASGINQSPNTVHDAHGDLHPQRLVRHGLVLVEQDLVYAGDYP